MAEKDKPLAPSDLRDKHAAEHDDGKTCGNVEEHIKLFNGRPPARPAP